MKDLVSIIIPIYNSEQYLKECLNSIIKQTYKKLEIILVLDGSNDSSKKIAYEYKNMDKRIKIIDRENKGALYSRIEGAKKATGKYITFIDSDDYMPDNAINDILEFWKINKDNNYSGIVALDVYENGEVIGKKLPNQKSTKIS